jgi:hypothetical protein
VRHHTVQLGCLVAKVLNNLCVGNKLRRISSISIRPRRLITCKNFVTKLNWNFGGLVVLSEDYVAHIITNVS